MSPQFKRRRDYIKHNLPLLNHRQSVDKQASEDNLDLGKDVVSQTELSGRGSWRGEPTTPGSCAAPIQAKACGLYSPTAEPASHLGRIIYAGPEERPEVEVGNNGMRCCYKLERSLGPTIVSKDKKRYAVFNTFDIRRDSYR